MMLDERVYKIVGDIPGGYVLTYGLVAALAGKPNGARLIGRIMSKAPEGLVSHRVVNHCGRTAPGWVKQVDLLKNEGVAFKKNGCVDLKKHLWKPIN